MTVEGGLPEPEELEPEQGSLRLASPDDTWTIADWERQAAAVLRKSGRMTAEDPDDLVWPELTHTTLDGIAITPLGTAALLDELATTGRPDRLGEWDIRSHLDARDAKLAHEEALADLEGGATSLWIEAEAGTDFGTLLDGVLLDLAPVVLDAPAAPVAAARALLSYAGERELAPGTNLGADPVGARLRGQVGDAAGLGSLVEVSRLARRAGTLGVVVDATAVHDLGGSDGQELGYALAVGAAYLRGLTAAGLTVDEAAGLMEFRYAATDEQFPTIAKLRAARRAWARVVELSEGGHPRQRQHVVTSRPMMSKYDPWVNMLRTTVAAFAASVGGADAVTVLPFDTPLGRPDAFGRRIARNTSHLLISESHLARVADPAGGAYAVEKLTDDLAKAAWAELGRIEESGGVLAALDDGSLTARIAETAERRDREIAHRTRPITGLSEFPNLAEVLPEREPAATADVRRYGAGFEALRDEPVERHVFLATLGPIAAHTGRATNARNLLAAGGIAVDVAGPTRDAADLADRYAGQPVVCLAGTDAAYAEWGTAAIAALRAAGAAWVVVAGPLLEGADDACATGVDALAFLIRTREKLQ